MIKSTPACSKMDSLSILSLDLLSLKHGEDRSKLHGAQADIKSITFKVCCLEESVGMNKTIMPNGQ